MLNNGGSKNNQIIETNVFENSLLFIINLLIQLKKMYPLTYFSLVK